MRRTGSETEELVREKAPKVVLTLEDKDDDTDVEIMGFSAEAGQQ